MAVHTTLEMSLSREEFFRFLPAAVGPFDVNGDTTWWSDGNRVWTIRLVTMPDRHLGSVAVPLLLVEIALDEYPAADAKAFMDRFHRGFLRGGG
jgi:hypothetical protein